MNTLAPRSRVVASLIGICLFLLLTIGSVRLVRVGTASGIVTPQPGAAAAGALAKSKEDGDGVVRPAAGGGLIISEFRLRGPGGAGDEFVEIYNDSNSPVTVNAPDGSSGFALVASDGVVRFRIPNGTVIPARGHFLGVNSLGYSLGTTGDATYTNNIRDNGADEGGASDGIALFNTSNPAGFTLANRLDAVGPVNAPELYREGAGYAASTSLENKYSLSRDVSGGTPKDTDDNAADFVYVARDGLSDGAGNNLDGPTPKNLKDVYHPLAECGALSFNRTDFAAGSFPSSVAVGDFNGDGKSDLAIVNQISK